MAGEHGDDLEVARALDGDVGLSGRDPLDQPGGLEGVVRLDGPDHRVGAEVLGGVWWVQGDDRERVHGVQSPGVTVVVLRVLRSCGPRGARPAGVG